MRVRCQGWGDSWRRKWQPTPVFLPGKSYGQRRLGSYNPRGHKASDMTWRLSTHAELINSAVLVLGGQQWGLSRTHTRVHSTPNSPPFRLPHSIHQSSMCHWVGPCWLPILNIAVCTCPFQIPKLSLCYARCPNPRAGREKASKTMQLAKREVYCWLESGLLPHLTQWCGSESPEPKLLHKFIGWAHTVGSWFKWIGYKFAKQFHWSKLSSVKDFPGSFCPIPNFLIGKQWSVLSES